MAGITELVRRALAELGSDGPDADIKAYVRQNDASVPDGHVGLALRKLRGGVIPSVRQRPRTDEPPKDGSY
jgi:hypothetical protein